MSNPALYRIRHQTHYEYGADVAHSHHLLHLVPRPAPYQECLEHAVDISPVPDFRGEEIDAFGNPVTRVEFEHPHSELEVTAHMEVRVHPRPMADASQTQSWEQVAEALAYNGRWPARASLDVGRFRHESPHVRIKRAFTDYAAECFEPEQPVLTGAIALMHKLHRDMRYAPGKTTISTPLMEVLEKRHGVCQDFAHLMIACLRSHGLAARYVSGYIRSSLTGGDASHAWVAVYAPPYGWVELDPTNDIFAGTEHVAVAWGRDFGDVSPLRGIILGGGSHQLSVNVAVQQVPEPEKP